ncbi:TnsA endonuclease N-terminal domain-containing protein [Sphingomonas sp. LB2R24]|uniref:TnsA endonuclease N-terminal domain-containing protein n=1 Tax=Sphingomonas sorbitolis TaxID=3096165 RepID=UPI002FC67703
MAKHRYPNTEKRIAKLVCEGRGQGHGKDYIPWIKIHDFSSLGRVHRPLSAKTRRVMHLLSDGENEVFLELDASPRVIDIREQYPLPRHTTIIIAEELGVRHPAANGVDAVMTTDLLVDLVGGRQVAFSVKTGEDMLKPRTIQKLEIERTYWARRGIECVLVVDGKNVDHRMNRQQVAEWRNIDNLVGGDVIEAESADMLFELANTVQNRLIDAIKKAEAKYGWVPGTGIRACKRLLATGLLIHVGDGRLNMRGPVTQVVIAGGAS